MSSIAGIDYSITCPSICIHAAPESAEFSIDNCQFYYIISTKKYCGEFLAKKIIGGYQEPSSFVSSIERYSALSDFFMDILEMHNCKEVAIEDYAYAATGQVFNIGENTGILKWKLSEVGAQIHKYAPTAIKKFATGKGNAKKEQMVEAFYKQTGINLFKQLRCESKKAISPISDIVDSYFIAKYQFYSGVLPTSVELTTA